MKQQDSQNVTHCKITGELPSQSLITATATMASASLRGRLVGHKLQSRPLVRKPLEIKSVFHLFLLRLFWTTLLIESLGSFDVSKHGHSSVLVTVHSLNFFCPQWLTPHPQGNSVLFPQPLNLNGPVDTGPEILNPDVSSSDCRALMWQAVYSLPMSSLWDLTLQVLWKQQGLSFLLKHHWLCIF